jgi:hypothetical protein
MDQDPGFASTVLTRRYRIVPRKGAALLYTLFFGFILCISLLSFDPDLGIATFDLASGGIATSQVITGTLAHYGLAAILIGVSTAFLVWFGRRLLPGSPFDFLEVGPDGLTVGGLLGRQYCRWQAIAQFSVRKVPNVQPPIFWLRAVPRKRGDKDLRFFIGGYPRFRFTPLGRKDVAAIAEWLEMVKASYRHQSDTALPTPPEELAARIIELPYTGVAKTAG